MSAERNPAELLIDISTLHMAARTLHVAAELGLADALGEEPMSGAALAAGLGADPDAVARVLRLLASHGVFAEEDGKFRHSPASRLMRTDHPESLRPWIRMMGADVNWSAYALMMHTLKTGESAREQVTGGDFFSDYLPRHPETAKLFDESMASAASRRIGAVVKAYDFSPYATIADIGGGRGHLIRGVLEATPSAQGILFDLPHAVEPTRALNPPRLKIIAGNFFTTPLPAADAYLLMAVIHDWDDADSLRILGAVRRAAPSHAKLILIERVLTEGAEAEIGKRMDIHMLVALTGRERTRAEFEKLFAASGFVLERIIPTGAGSSILEGRPR